MAEPVHSRLAAALRSPTYGIERVASTREREVDGAGERMRKISAEVVCSAMTELRATVRESFARGYDRREARRLAEESARGLVDGIAGALAGRLRRPLGVVVLVLGSVALFGRRR